MAQAITAATTTLSSLDNHVVIVDDVKALRKAVHDEMECIGCGLHQYRVVTYVQIFVACSPCCNVIFGSFCRILGFGNVADAVEILAIGYILTVYEESEGAMTPWESSMLQKSRFYLCSVPTQINVKWDIYV